MITGFKKRFEYFVGDGSKEHTLRDLRRGDRQVQVGDRLDCYANVRQKNQRLIGRWTCIRVQVARFELWAGSRHGAVMLIDDVELSPDEADQFAWRDGFRHMIETPAGIDLKPYSHSTAGCFRMMMAYWINEGKTFPFEKQLLHWKFADRLPDELPRKAKRPRR